VAFLKAFKLVINSVVGNYLVDSGAQVVALNRPHFDATTIDTVVMNHSYQTSSTPT
jgi:hypothetical protein